MQPESLRHQERILHVPNWRLVVPVAVAWLLSCVNEIVSNLFRANHAFSSSRTLRKQGQADHRSSRRPSRSGAWESNERSTLENSLKGKGASRNTTENLYCCGPHSLGVERRRPARQRLCMAHGSAFDANDKAADGAPSREFVRHPDQFKKRLPNRLSIAGIRQ